MTLYKQYSIDTHQQRKIPTEIIAKILLNSIGTIEKKDSNKKSTNAFIPIPKRIKFVSMQSCEWAGRDNFVISQLNANKTHKNGS